MQIALTPESGSRSELTDILNLILLVHFRRDVSSIVPPRPHHINWVLDSLCCLWKINKKTCIINKKDVLVNLQLAMLLLSERREFHPHIMHRNYAVLCGLYTFGCVRASKLKQHICLSPEAGRKSKLTPMLKLTPVYFRGVVTDALEIWQLAKALQCELREFSPYIVSGNFAVSREFTCARVSNLNQHIWISPEPVRDSKLT